MIAARYKLVIALAIFLVAAPGSAIADDASLNDASSREKARQLVVDFLQAADSYTAVFDQQLSDDEGALLEQSKGEFWLARPGRFRWHYASPLERLIISDGKRIWLFDPDLDQVTVRNADGALDQTPAGLLVSGEQMLDAFELSLGESSSSLETVRLVPVGMESDFRVIELGLHDNRLRRLTLEDRFGQQTRIDFYDIRLNPQLDTKLFTFEAPAGIDVIDQTGM
jgi:outer membrane lipoprotein carrier protein